MHWIDGLSISQQIDMITEMRTDLLPPPFTPERYYLGILHACKNYVDALAQYRLPDYSNWRKHYFILASCALKCTDI